MTTTITLEITPLDVLFFRDGRPFEGAAQVCSGQAAPQTLAGALRTWLLRQAGCDFERIRLGVGFAQALDGQSEAVRAVAALRFRGPWFIQADAPLVPVPAILRRKSDRLAPLERLAPLREPPPGWRNADGLYPLWPGVGGKLEGHRLSDADRAETLSRRHRAGSLGYRRNRGSLRSRPPGIGGDQ